MDYIDFTEDFLRNFENSNKEASIQKYWNKEKTLLSNYPYKNINVEIKPKNSGLFVIQLIQFEFFNYPLLEDYWKKILKHEDARFILNSRCIYVYPNQKENVELCLNVLNFTTETILSTIRQIKTLLTQADGPQDKQ